MAAGVGRTAMSPKKRSWRWRGVRVVWMEVREVGVDGAETAGCRRRIWCGRCLVRRSRRHQCGGKGWGSRRAIWVNQLRMRGWVAGWPGAEDVARGGTRRGRVFLVEEDVVEVCRKDSLLGDDEDVEAGGVGGELARFFAGEEAAGGWQQGGRRRIAGCARSRGEVEVELMLGEDVELVFLEGKGGEWAAGRGRRGRRGISWRASRGRWR